MNTHEDTGAKAGCGGKAAEGGHSCCGGHGHAHDHDHHHHHHDDADSCCDGHGGCGSGESCCGGGKTAGAGVLVFSRKQIREVDRLATEEFGIPSILLMENAARGVAGVILEGLQGLEQPTALVVCGPGNNGGDGLAVARHLVNRGVKIAIVLAAPAGAFRGDAKTNLTIAQKMDLPIFDGSANEAAAGSAMAAASAVLGDTVVIIDALLGTGLDRPATGVMAELIAQMNAMRTQGATTVAIDVPSGLDCDIGEPGTDSSGSGPVVEADLTVALAGVKAGFLTATAQKHVGELVVVDIGAPRELVSRIGRPLTMESMPAKAKASGGGCGSGGCGCH